jgi:hypothetical protein
MNNAEEAQVAIKTLNGQESNGRTLTVNEARPRQTIAAGAVVLVAVHATKPL